MRALILLILFSSSQFKCLLVLQHNFDYVVKIFKNINISLTIEDYYKNNWIILYFNVINLNIKIRQ